MRISYLICCFWGLGLSSCSQDFELTFSGDINGEVSEVSGITGNSQGRLFVIGDSGNENTVYEVNSSGLVTHEISIIGAQNVDWEELQSDVFGTLYIGDIGNNLSQRQDLVIYKIPHFMDSLSRDSISTFETIHFSYSDQDDFTPDGSGNFDCEAFVVLGDKIRLFSKDHSGSNVTKTYEMPNSAGTHVAQLISSTPLDFWITGASIDSRTMQLVLSSDADVLQFSNYEVGSVHCHANLETSQLEGIFVNDFGKYILVEDVELNNQFSKLFELIMTCENDITCEIFPNPAEDLIYIVSESIFYSVKIHNILGGKVFQMEYDAGAKREILNLKQLDSGNYIMSIDFENSTAKKTFTKD